MSEIDNVRLAAADYFSHLSENNYVRILDTPRVWGLPFNRGIMPQARQRQAEFERALVEIVQKARFRCDIASLNSPDPDWGRIILGAMDTALTAQERGMPAIQFRFLFGQTPTSPVSEPANFTDFKGALIRLMRIRGPRWNVAPEIWLGRFYRLRKGVLSSLKSKLFSETIVGDAGTRMTWNHCKIVAVDGNEALVGGHNLNMDLFRSYPPVHDVSVVVHGEAAFGAQMFLNRMWECGTDLLTKEILDTEQGKFANRDQDAGAPPDPICDDDRAVGYMLEVRRSLLDMHRKGVQAAADETSPIEEPGDEVPRGMYEQDLKTLEDLELAVFPERIVYPTYDRFDEYRLATRVLAIGKYWTGPSLKTDYQKASEIMKEHLIKNARKRIRMSQMDLISAWKKNWSDHVVCHWIIEALIKNEELIVEVVVSPLDAGAGAEGDQYSFGSGAIRTFELISYYMTHSVKTDKLLRASETRARALKRLFIAPLFFTSVDGQPIEGDTYKWPDLDKEGYTATLKQPLLRDQPPNKGVIGSAADSVLNASGLREETVVKSAPGNHAKIMIVDDELYVVGSDNLYPGFLSEFNYVIEGKDAMQAMLESYWLPLWSFSGPHAHTGS